MRCVQAFAIGGALLVASTSVALPQEASGKTVGVVPEAAASGSRGFRVLALEQAVFMGDRVQTGAAGEAQILFHDDTRVVVGPNASMLIDSYVVRDKNRLRDFALTALRGAFRFSTGKSPKSAYAIKTPTMTLSVRGTRFDFTVAPDGGTDFVLLHGQAQVCDRSGNCILARQLCNVISIPPNGSLRTLSRTERLERLRADFPYITQQRARLRQDFQASVSSCGSIPQPTQLQPAQLNQPNIRGLVASGYRGSDLTSAPSPSNLSGPPSRGGQDTGRGGHDTGRGGQDTGRGGQDTGRGGQDTGRGSGN